MGKLIKKFHNHHRKFWTKEHLKSLFYSILLLAFALFIQKTADNYVIKLNWAAVGDILLNNIPTIDIDGFIVLSTLIFTFIVMTLMVFKPNYIFFAIKSLALFVITRSFFICLTHLWVSPDQIVFDPDSIGFWLYDLVFNSRNDFFFSGHTGLPFLMSLVFYKEKFWRNAFLVTSIIFAVSVIVAHIHYSIDVFAAPFITYSIYTISRKLFKRDFSLISR